MLDSIIYRNADGTFTLWELDIPDGARDAIESILMRYDTRGTSIQGTPSEIAREIETL